MVGAYDGEVAPVDSRNLGDAQALSRGDDRCIHGAQRQVAVARNQLSDPQPVRDRHRLNGERATGEIAEEADLGLCAQASREQRDHLGDDERWDDERTRVGLQQLE
jgi:hypothetical protein